MRSERSTKLVKASGGKGIGGADYCGPTAVSALTGRSMECVAAWVNSWRGAPAHFNPRGTCTWELANVLLHLGYGLGARRSYRKGDQPTLAAWLRERSGEDRRTAFLLNVSFGTGREYYTGRKFAKGHWVAVCGNRFVDTWTRGEVVTTSKAPHRRKRVVEVHPVLVRGEEWAKEIRRKRRDPMPGQSRRTA